MTKLLIVYHSATGGTRAMAQAAMEGALNEAGMTTLCLPACETGPEHLLSSDGYIFASPENLAAMAGMMKDFFDRTYYPVLDRLNGRPYATLICAGTDGRNAAAQITRIATGWRLKAIADPIIARTGAQTPEAIQAPAILSAADLTQCSELGQAMASGLAMGIF